MTTLTLKILSPYNLTPMNSDFELQELVTLDIFPRITRSSYDADAGVVLTLLQLENLSTRRKKLKRS